MKISTITFSNYLKNELLILLMLNLAMFWGAGGGVIYAKVGAQKATIGSLKKMAEVQVTTLNHLHVQ